MSYKVHDPISDTVKMLKSSKLKERIPELELIVLINLLRSGELRNIDNLAYVVRHGDVNVYDELIKERWFVGMIKQHDSKDVVFNSVNWDFIMESDSIMDYMNIFNDSAFLNNIEKSRKIITILVQTFDGFEKAIQMRSDDVPRWVFGVLKRLEDIMMRKEQEKMHTSRKKRSNRSRRR